MERRLGELGVETAAPVSTKERVVELYARYCAAGRGGRGGPGGGGGGGEADRAEGRRLLGELQEAGFDLGHGHDREHGAPPAIEARLGELFRHARKALYATLAEAVVRDATTRPLRVSTRAGDREEYIARPAAGEALRDADRAALRSLYPAGPPQVQLVVSDGLNADAVNESLRAVLPAVRAQLAAAGCRVGERDVVIRNGRVRAGYEVGELLGVEVIVHLIGERPGTGLDQLSAYLTYGRDGRGQPRWARGLDHSCTTAICGIHRHGKPAEVAVEEIVGNVRRMLEERRSGVALGTRVARH
jgi:ethanolamine ammonia-lyase small subunit